MSYRAAIYLRVAAIVGLVVVGFVVLQAPMRRFETEASAGLLQLFGATDVRVVHGFGIAVFPASHPAFVAYVTPACSSLAAALAILALGSVAPHPDRAQKAQALAVAVSLVVAGNVIRIAASVGVGFVAGRASLVLFHDWVGGLITFLYILGAYIVFLYLLLPRKRLGPLPSHVPS